MIDQEIFRFLTPFIYWLLIIFWFFIAIFYLQRILKKQNKKDKFLKVLLIILFIDALRTFIESSYFGIWFTSLAGLIDIKFYNILARPEIVFFPKIINLIVSFLIIIIILRRWLPEENSRILDFKKLIDDQKIILEQIPVTVIITDTDGNIEYANNKFYSLTGYSKLEIIGHNPRILNSGKFIVTNYKEMWNTLNSGKEWKGLFHNKKKNGDLYWERANIKPLIDNGGNIRNFLAIKEDITEEIAATNQKEMLLTTMEQISDTIEILDISGRIQYVNSSFTKLYGYSKEEVIGKYPIDLFSDGRVLNRDINEKFSKAMKEQRRCEGRFLNKTKNGEWLTEDVSITPIFDIYGKLTNYSATKRNVTEAIKKEKEQKSIREQLNQAQRLESVGQLVGGISHDFNNSLGGIMAAAQLLENPKRELDKKSISYVQMIIKSSRRAADLTKKLLTFSKIQKSQFSNIHIYNVVKDTTDILKQTINKAISIEIISDYNMDIISGDISGLQSALINFGINASHAISGTGYIKFKISNKSIDSNYCNLSSFTINPGNYCSVEVEDSGCGIEDKNLNKIFDPFFTTKKQNIGTGLGLASTQRTIREHSGAIEVKSILGKGTSFKVLLPCSTGIETVTKEEKSTIQGIGKILLIDDEEINRTLGEDILNTLGYSVLLAQDGKEALSIYKDEKNKIDLILLDMIMPQMSGQELFFKLKDINKDCKIIILSGYIGDVDMDNLKKNGLNAIIKKPYIISEFSQTISSVLLS